MLKSDDLINKVKSYNKFLNPETLSKAYDFALKAHEKQKRDEGSPYIIHPVAVADIYVYIFIDTYYFVSCFSVIQRMPLGDIPVTIWLDAVIFSRSFATLVSLLSLMLFASGDVVCAVHEYGPSLRHEGHLTLIREQKVYLRFLRVWRTTSVTGN